MLGELRDERSHHAQVVRAFPDPREEIAHGQAAFASRQERPGTTERGPIVVELGRFHFQGEGFSVLRLQAWLGIEGVHLGRAAVHVEEDHPPGAGCDRGQEPGGGQRAGRSEGGEGDRSESVGTTSEHFAPRQWRIEEPVTVGHGDYSRKRNSLRLNNA